MSTCDSRIVRSVTAPCPGESRCEDESCRAGPTRSRRTARRPVPRTAAAIRHAPSTCCSQLVVSPASTATQPRSNARPRVGVSAREAAPGHNRPQVLGTDRHAGERLERRRRRRVAEHAPLPRQDERRVVADRDVGEDGLARRGKLEADLALALRSPHRPSRGDAAFPARPEIDRMAAIVRTLRQCSVACSYARAKSGKAVPAPDGSVTSRGAQEAVTRQTTASSRRIPQFTSGLEPRGSCSRFSPDRSTGRRRRAPAPRRRRRLRSGAA